MQKLSKIEEDVIEFICGQVFELLEGKDKNAKEYIDGIEEMKKQYLHPNGDKAAMGVNIFIKAIVSEREKLHGLQDANNIVELYNNAGIHTEDEARWVEESEAVIDRNIIESRDRAVEAKKNA